MNREIKFELIYQNPQTKDIQKRVWSLDELINRGVRDYTVSGLWEGYEVIAKRQFTGLLDKNGVKIYEGDILKAGYKDKAFIVLWKHNCWWLTPILPFHSGRGVGIGKIKGGTVIGNIYENPNLLNP